MNNLIYVELSKSGCSQSVLEAFDCKHPDFNDFLVTDAKKCGESGNGVTYILVDKEDYDNSNITVIFAFATIQAMSLHFHKDSTERLYDLSCVEIKYFAISRKLQKVIAYDIDESKYYSTIFFEYLLQDLHSLSTTTIGFQAIFLRANKNGEKLYKRKHFADASEYIVPYTDDDPLGKCAPMILNISDNIYSIFGCD